METVVMVAGAVAQFLGWRRAAIGRRNVWRVMPIVLGAMAVAAVAVHPPVAAAKVTASRALGIGAGSGVALYLATRVFVVIAQRWRPFHRGVVRSYAEAATVPLITSLALSLFIIVPAEELFWRGLVQGHLQEVMGAAVGAAFVTWLVYVGANLTSGSLPIVAGAIVGGALWTGLAWWSGGVLAGLASHILWTGLMLALPPGAGRREGVTI
jgi:membrane protease YdiL (CAAX protease family)